MVLNYRALTAALLVPLLGGSAALAADPPPLKIGMITTLSTAGGYLGEDVRLRAIARSAKSERRACLPEGAGGNRHAGGRDDRHNREQARGARN